MRLTNAERQKKHREKMKKQNLSLVRVWVPKDKVMEIKSMAIRFVKESLRNEKFR
ncbi:MAG: antitoxin MazE family protein [Alphaproteobacteria bacterium]|nr:antitoxin MazE family protein [Alphaproteobacteria bacterium]